MRAVVFLLLFLVALPVSRGRYNDDFDDGEDLADFDDNDFAEFEELSEDSATETEETAPPPRFSAQAEEEEDDEATVELEEGQDGFDDPDTQVREGKEKRRERERGRRERETHREGREEKREREGEREKTHRERERGKREGREGQVREREERERQMREREVRERHTERKEKRERRQRHRERNKKREKKRERKEEREEDGEREEKEERERREKRSQSERETGEGEEEREREEKDQDLYSKYDQEEFEGIGDMEKTGHSMKDPLIIHTVPAHLQNSWESYYMEILMVTGLLAYIMNYIIGKNKNSRLAHAWFNSHRELLESNFALVGDDGTSKEAVSTGTLNQENEHIYNLWCSGRVCCEGMLIQLKFLKRQDLLNVLARMMRPVCDQVVSVSVCNSLKVCLCLCVLLLTGTFVCLQQIKVTLNDEDMDTFVFAVGTKKAMARLQKEMQDLSEFCGDKPKSGAKFGLPESLAILSEMGEVTDGVMDNKMVHYITNHADKIESIHFSDQFSGPKIMQEEGQPLKLPETKKTLLFTFNVPGMGHTSPKDMDSLLPLMNMVIYSIDKVKEAAPQQRGKQKADRNRARVEENFLKQTHAQRQEAAQSRREEKKRAEKERIMNEEDPERQRRLEEAAQRREQKKMEKKQMKMKQIKVKAM
ncbi:hypothetical protein WMY93_002062 [Mugilogobius chulae]|uniref:PAT complex subunit CCDC47 n=1 Tax=Mugilogobius chulae TaxID=88201 RepID=A0AAW0Q7M8_9GOBI